MIGCKHTGEIEYDLDKALVVVPLKRKLKAFYYFSRLYLHFFRSGKLLRKFQISLLRKFFWKNS